MSIQGRWGVWPLPMLPSEKVLASAIQGNTVPGDGSSQEFGDLGVCPKQGGTGLLRF